MIYLAGFLSLMLGLLFLGTIFFAIVQGLSQWNKCYEGVAQRYSATFFRGYLFSRPRLRFDYGRTSVRLQNRKSKFRGRPVTEMQMEWPDRRLSVEVATKEVGQANRRRWRNRRNVDVNVEDKAFSESLNVKANDPRGAEKLLVAPVRWQIEQLRRHLGTNQVRVELHRGTLTLSKEVWMKHPQALSDFVRFGLELFDQMQLTMAEGINFVNEDKATLVDDVLCPICSEKIIVEIVVCLRCKTPHCHDCWQYNGQCATFACDETRYVRGDGKIVTT